MANSTVPARPSKPRPDFPLFPHRNGLWAKKIRGRSHYFGTWADDRKGERAALLWAEQKDDLLAGRDPNARRDVLILRDLCNEFMTAQLEKRDAGELSPRSFADYLATAERLIEVFGKMRFVEELRPDDFRDLRRRCTKKWGVHRVSGEVQRVRTIFKFGYDNELLDKPVRFGSDFKRPAAKSMREHRQKQRLKYGSRMFSAAETRRLLAAANQPLRAMIMLAINCGYGNNDVGLLPLSAVDLKEGWINFPRPKTAVERHSPLWPETIEAVHDAIARRPTPADAEYEEFVFLTRFGFPWTKDIADSPVTKEFTKLLLRVDNAAAKAAKKRGEATPVKIRRKGCNFYALRHSFETVAGGAQDQVAVDRLMGHVDHTMAANYREDVDGRPIEADRLLRVVNHVHAWLWPRPTTDKN